MELDQTPSHTAIHMKKLSTKVSINCLKKSS